MKSMIFVMVAVLMLMSWEYHQTEAVLCPDIGWGGCSDGGCYRCGGYCINYGTPPNNDCQCRQRINRVELIFKNRRTWREEHSDLKESLETMKTDMEQMDET